MAPFLSMIVACFLGEFLHYVFDPAFYFDQFTPCILNAILDASIAVFNGLELSACIYCRILIYRRDIWLEIFRLKYDEIAQWEKDLRNWTGTDEAAEKLRHRIARLREFMDAAIIIIVGLPAGAWHSIFYTGMTSARSFNVRYVLSCYLSFSS
jgi:hypothetical protein